MPSKSPASADKKSVAKPRKLAMPTYRSFRLQKKIKPVAVKLPNSFTLFKQAIQLLATHWKLFLGIVAVYTVLNLLLVQSFLGVDLGQAKAAIADSLQGGWGKVIGGFSLLSYLAGTSSGISSQAAGAYRSMLVVVVSLALIWALRQVIAKKDAVRVRDSFYDGMYPLAPFLLVFLVITLELIPFATGTYFFNLAGSANGAEVILWIVVLGALALLTLYLMSSTLFALYIACLPGMRPMAALRSARELVRYRRWSVGRRLLFLPLALIIIISAIMIPIILFATPLAVGVFFVLALFVLPVVHSYMYLLYRELLHEK